MPSCWARACWGRLCARLWFLWCFGKTGSGRRKMNTTGPNRAGSTMEAGTIAEIQLTDGTVRPVFEDGRGQYVLDDGEPVYGVWVIPQEHCDAPVIVEAVDRK